MYTFECNDDDDFDNNLITTPYLSNVRCWARHIYFTQNINIYIIINADNVVLYRNKS